MKRSRSSTNLLALARDAASDASGRRPLPSSASASSLIGPSSSSYPGCDGGSGSSGGRPAIKRARWPQELLASSVSCSSFHLRPPAHPAHAGAPTPSATFAPASSPARVAALTPGLGLGMGLGGPRGVVASTVAAAAAAATAVFGAVPARAPPPAHGGEDASVVFCFKAGGAGGGDVSSLKGGHTTPGASCLHCPSPASVAEPPSGMAAAAAFHAAYGAPMSLPLPRPLQKQPQQHQGQQEQQQRQPAAAHEQSRDLVEELVREMERLFEQQQRQQHQQAAAQGCWDAAVGQDAAGVEEVASPCLGVVSPPWCVGLAQS